jgi:TRAP-type C4-dicarboxylate transport system permease small subunit
MRGRIASFCGYLTAACLAGMMLLIVADVVMRSFFSRPIHGVIDLVELLLAGAFFLALPATFLRDEHIVVDIVDHRFPRLVPVLKRASALIAVVALAVMGWQGWIAARDATLFGDVTSDLSLPKLWYWIPVLAGIIGAAAAAAAMALAGDEPR